MMLDVDGVGFKYRSVPVLDNVTFSAGKAEVVSILGPNGVGKTTLLKCMNGILKAKDGTVLVDEEDLGRMSKLDVAKRIGYVAQRGDSGRVTVFESVLLGRKPHIRWDISKKDVQLAGKMIDLLGLTPIAMSYVQEISGGEFQKVQIARALVQEPKVLLLDEPTSNLDLSNQCRIMSSVRDMVKMNGISAIMTMHDLNLAIRYSDRFILLRGGRIYAAGGVEVLTPEAIEDVYGISVFVEVIRGQPTVVLA
ncbi:MAG: ABC transporter ATP-binding protein [Methanomassiliicoccus sp.]|nr:ABC transporter ATP-binding protein [Methanomassiliicoccus sp.]